MDKVEATAKNEKIARTIVNLLAENECTLDAAFEILDYVRDTVQERTTVQNIHEKLFVSAQEV
ncbi:hypothetical protein CEB3_c21210 [Peptococcaceae bacterium CEB3]|nr:hypothetical protein CEB3_c21210 [Peptococcaceae bacterium CEB3]